jgi:hypothetical protein
LVVLQAASASQTTEVNANALRLDLEVISQRYCNGDSEVGTLQLKSKLRFTNTGQRPLLLFKGAGMISRVIVASTADGGARPELDMLVTTISDSSHAMHRTDRPGTNFVTLHTNKAFETDGLVAIPFRRAETRIASLIPGLYFLQVSAETWPDSRQPGTVLREHWKAFGYLWLDSVTSRPLAVTIDRNPTIVSCE